MAPTSPSTPDTAATGGQGSGIEVSFEFFPPKTEKMEQTLWASIEKLGAHPVLARTMQDLMKISMSGSGLGHGETETRKPARSAGGRIPRRRPVRRASRPRGMRQPARQTPPRSCRSFWTSTAR